MKKIIIGLKSTMGVIIALSAIGCVSSSPTSPYKTFYTQRSPSTYPPTTNALVHFHYSSIGIDEIRALFEDYLVIGESGFYGPGGSSHRAIAHGKSIGSDIIVTTIKFKETITKQVATSVPTHTTSYGGFFAGSSIASYTPITTTTYGTKTVTKPITTTRYVHDALFLKNLNNINPLWEQTETKYPKTETNQLEGIWGNKNYRLNVFQSGKYLVGFVINAQRKGWKQGDLKVLCGTSLGDGIYLMDDKSPMPVKVSVNKFGHLEIKKLIGGGGVFSFTRYVHDALFLKNLNNINPLWEQTETKYPKTETHHLEGIWKNKKYRLNVFQSGKYLVGFVIDAQRKGWKQGDLKVLCGTSLGDGMYLMGDKSPIPVKVSVNKFGHLEVKELTGDGDVFSFEKEQ